MRTYAQTVIQLFHQLQREGYSRSSLDLVGCAYGVAMRLFSGLHRASGQPGVTHGVRTASVLCSLRAGPELVAAGLIHNAYGNRDFGLRDRGTTEPKRRHLRAAVGEEVEQIVFSFSTFFEERSLADLVGGIGELDRTDTMTIMLYLAETLEKHLDMDILYGLEEGQYRRFADCEGLLMVELAGKVGLPSLASELHEALAAGPAAEAFSQLQSLTGRRDVLLPPNSYCKRS